METIMVYSPVFILKYGIMQYLLSSVQCQLFSILHVNDLQ